MPLPLTVSCFSEIQIGFTFLVPAHPGSPGQAAVKCVCARMCESAGSRSWRDSRDVDRRGNTDYDSGGGNYRGGGGATASSNYHTDDTPATRRIDLRRPPRTSALHDDDSTLGTSVINYYY